METNNENNSEFRYTYSAKEQVEIKKIREKYLQKENEQEDKMTRLRRLDAKVKRPANVFDYVFGSIGAIVMGGGMSLVMTDIAESVGISGDPMIMGIAVGVIGLAMALVNYPIYKGILKSRKKKYAQSILELSEKIIGENK